MKKKSTRRVEMHDFQLITVTASGIDAELVDIIRKATVRIGRTKTELLARLATLLATEELATVEMIINGQTFPEREDDIELLVTCCGKVKDVSVETDENSDTRILDISWDPEEIDE
jgi:hypothetical protein